MRAVAARAAETVSPGPGLPEPLLAMRPKAIWQAFRGEHFAFIGIAFYLFFEYVKPEQAYPIFGILPFLRLSWLAAFIGIFSDKQSGTPTSWMNRLLVLFLVHCLVSAVLAYDPAYSFARFGVITLWVVIYFLITTIVTTERRLFLFFVVYLLSNFKMAQFGFITWAKRGFAFASWGLTGSGWFKNSGELGMEMSMFFAYTLCMAIFLRQHWTGWRKWVMYSMPFTAAACVVASSSRGAIVGSIAVLFYLSLFARKKVRSVLASALFVVIGYFVMPPQFLNRFHSAGEDATSLSRLFYWSKAKLMMHEHPIFGVGYYNWVPYYRDHYFDPNLYWRIEEAHNTFWQLGAELGYVGLGIFIALVAASFIINWESERRCRRPGFEYLRSVSMGMNAAGIGLVFASMFLTAYFMPNFWIHFALTVAVRNAIDRKIAAGGSDSPVKVEPRARGRPAPLRYGRRAPITS